MSGTRQEHDATWSATIALEARERQVALWRHVLIARYAAIVGAAAIALTPAAGPRGGWVALIAIAVVLPYNTACDLWLRRRGELPPAMAYTDQVLAVGLVAFAPELTAPLLLVMLSITATAAVSFGRRIAGQSAAAGALGVGLLLVLGHAEEVAGPFLVFLIGSVFIVAVVGLVADVERTIRIRYAELMGGIDAVVWEQLTRSPSTLYVNRRAEEVLGYPVAAWRTPGFWGRIVHPDDRMAATRAYRDAILRGESREVEYRMIAADGRVVHVHDRMRVETDAGGRVAHVRGVLLDVTEQRRAEERVQQYVNLVEKIKLGLFVFQLDHPDGAALRLLAVNPEAARITGVDAGRARGRLVEEVLHVPDVEDLADHLTAVVRTGEEWFVEEFRTTTGDARGRVYAAYAFPLPGRAVALSLQDVTERVVAAEVLRRQALHDGLTGLPNRTLLHERLTQALAHSERTGEPVALLLMDLDQFKEVNDALGHHHGDRLLIEMSRRMQRVLRDVDTVARLGGDEFAVLVTTGADEAGALEVARRIRSALDEPFQLGGISVQATGSIGVALCPGHATEAEALAQRADVAMYAAKRGGGGIALYAPEHDQSSVRRLALLGELRQAIQDDDLVLHYQPVLDLRHDRIVGVEALVRWDHREHGLMPPAEFIDLAEVSGLIQPLTRWVIEEAVRRLGIWQSASPPLAVSVNLSVRNLFEPDLVRWLGDLLDRSGLDPGRLTLEITESELMDDPLVAMEVLGRLKSLGVATSIDDFGTGYSSLSYLKHLPIDELKIDRSFVGAMVHDDNDLTIVRSTIDLSHNLGLDVVAEGVEDPETLEMLRALGCDRAQGHLIGPPCAPQERPDWAWARADGRAPM